MSNIKICSVCFNKVESKRYDHLHDREKCQKVVRDYDNTFNAFKRFRNKALDRRFATLHVDEGAVL